MRYASALSTSTEPYRAGTEIAEALLPSSPEVVLLFSAITYKGGLGDLFAGLSDTLDNPKLIIVGGTGDGVYETRGAANYAVSALGINSDGAMRWAAAVECGVQLDSPGVARLCIDRAKRDLGGEPSFCFVLADGVTADGEGILRGLSEVAHIPIVGGLAGDDRRFTETKVYFNGAEYNDAVVVLLGSGTMPFAVNAASGWRPFGSAGLVEKTAHSAIVQVGGMTAKDFISGQIGKPFGEIDLGVVSLSTYQEGLEGPFFLRSTSRINEDGSLNTFGSVQEGVWVRVCTATREAVLQGVEQSASALLTQTIGFEPKAAIVVSCAARKWLLEDCGDRELASLSRSLGRTIPLAGFPSFGEFSPFLTENGYSPNFFHNVTFVLCVLGG